MKKYNIIGVHVTDRIKKVNDVQKILTKYGHDIRTRLGLHETSENSPNGVILIEVESPSYKVLKDELSKIDGIELKVMKF